MAVLSKGAIFAVAPASREVEVEEWGGSVFVRAHTLKTRMALMDAVTERVEAVAAYERDQALDEDDREGLTKVDHYDEAVITIIFSLVNEKGDCLFDVGDYDRLRELSYSTLVSLWATVKQVNAAKPVSFADLKKNSD